MQIRTVKDLKELLNTFRDDARVVVIFSDAPEEIWGEVRCWPATPVVRAYTDCELIVDGK